MPATTPKGNGSPDDSRAKKEAAKIAGNGPRFVRCDLVKAQKEQLQSWAADEELVDTLAWLYNKVINGHVVSLRSLEVGYQCSVTGMTEASGHKDMVLTAKASTPERALMGARFRDEVVLIEGWPSGDALAELDF